MEIKSLSLPTIYILLEIFSRLSAIIFLPLIVNNLSVEEYSLLIVINILLLITTPLIDFQQIAYYAKHYYLFSLKRNFIFRAILFKTSILVAIFLVLISLILNKNYFEYSILVVFTVLAKYIYNVYKVKLRSDFNMKSYAVMSGLLLIVESMLLLVLWATNGLVLKSRLITLLLAHLLAVLIVNYKDIIKCIQYFNQVNLQLVFIKNTVPLCVSTILYFIFISSDRLLLISILSNKDFAQFGLWSTLSSIILLISAGLNSYVSPKLYKCYSSSNELESARLIKISIIFLVITNELYLQFLPYLEGLFSHYYLDGNIVRILSYANLGLAIISLLSNKLMYVGKQNSIMIGNLVLVVSFYLSAYLFRGNLDLFCTALLFLGSVFITFLYIISNESIRSNYFRI